MFVWPNYSFLINELFSLLNKIVVCFTSLIIWPKRSGWMSLYWKRTKLLAFWLSLNGRKISFCQPPLIYCLFDLIIRFLQLKVVCLTNYHEYFNQKGNITVIQANKIFDYYQYFVCSTFDWPEYYFVICLTRYFIFFNYLIVSLRNSQKFNQTCLTCQTTINQTNNRL